MGVCFYCSAVSDPATATLPAQHFSCHTFLPAGLAPARHQPASPGSSSPFCHACEQGKEGALWPPGLGTTAAMRAEGPCHFGLPLAGLYTPQPHALVPCCAPCLCWPACAGERAVPPPKGEVCRRCKGAGG